jgi:hypothetical protein
MTDVCNIMASVVTIREQDPALAYVNAAHGILSLLLQLYLPSVIGSLFSPTVCVCVCVAV